MMTTIRTGNYRHVYEAWSGDADGRCWEGNGLWTLLNDFLWLSLMIMITIMLWQDDDWYRNRNCWLYWILLYLKNNWNWLPFWSCLEKSDLDLWFESSDSCPLEKNPPFRDQKLDYTSVARYRSEKFSNSSPPNSSHASALDPAPYITPLISLHFLAKQ